jgi:hypothetical protein
MGLEGGCTGAGGGSTGIAAGSAVIGAAGAGAGAAAACGAGPSTDRVAAGRTCRRSASSSDKARPARKNPTMPRTHPASPRRTASTKVPTQSSNAPLVSPASRGIPECRGDHAENPVAGSSHIGLFPLACLPLAVARAMPDRTPTDAAGHPAVDGTRATGQMTRSR